ncbi:MAG: hypothetical protein OSB09_02630 [Planctomycetota bacterium]|nr:hypothetical protein [Planctomycetota bacterium]
MMNSSRNARERILALERIRVVETELIQCSLPLIRRLVEDLSSHLGSKLPQRWHQWLLRGDLWWAAASGESLPDDPRRFPVVRQVVDALEEESGDRWQPDLTLRDGIGYSDLIEPISVQLQLRTELARIAQIGG